MMKNILFFLSIIIGLSNSVYAINLDTYERAMIVEIDIVNDGTTNPNYGFLWQVSQEVIYKDWYSTYPYDRFKYVGEVTNWAYTTDFSNFYLYDSSYLPYLNPDDAQFTHIWVKMPSYAPNDYWLQRGLTGVKVTNRTCSNGYCHYIDAVSQDVTKYEMVTQILLDEGGSADLYNTVYFDRRSY